jgi:predicted nucleic acid-binding protein
MPRSSSRHRAIGILGADHAWKQRVALQKWLQTAGKPIPVEDSYIAAIAHRHNLTLLSGT